jgi:hypothetical protein
MATKNVTIPKSYKGLKAVYITPSEEGLLRRTSHPKGSSQPAKGPGGLLMMKNGGGEEERDRSFAKKHGLTYKEVTEAGGSTMRTSKLKAIKAVAKTAKKEVKKTSKEGAKKAKVSTDVTRKVAAAPPPAAWSGTDHSPDVRGGYDPSGSVDYTNTNPAYWASAVSYFRAHPDGNRVTGELGIWIPNLEKEGAERTALAAIAGGVTAHVNSNYSNNTVGDVRLDGTRRATASLTGPGSESYTGGAEKAIRLAGTHRGGTEVTGPGIGPMGSTAPSEHGVYIKGGVVVKSAGVDYVKGGGDFGGLLSRGDAITGDWLTGVLGAMDKDGMRIGGTYPGVAGATGSGIGAGGTKTSVGGLYAGGVDPLASMPKVADYTAYMDPNSIFGGLSKNAAVRSGLLYQPMASDYGAKMSAAGMPAFSPGMLGVGGGVTSPTYSSPPGSFMKPKATTATTAAVSKYAFPTGIPLYGGAMSKDIPSFASAGVLSSKYPSVGSYGAAHPLAKGTAKVGGTLYEFEGGGDAGAGDWVPTSFSYPLVTGTT